MTNPATQVPVHVAKFGGTSMGTPERVKRAIALAAAAPAGHRRVVVSSAFGGVTDRLIEAIDAAVSRSDAYRAILRELRERHDAAVAALVPLNERDQIAAHLDGLFTEVGELLHGISLLRECTPRFRDAIISAGERASVPIIAAAFRAAGIDAVALDATRFIRTDEAFGEAAVDAAATRKLVRAAMESVPADAFAVVTGFVASTAEGVTTTLGRSGSDYTATILAGALDAVECVIWTDVNGVLSADPRVVPDAFSLPSLSYEEAAELAHFGAKVLHPRTMRPLQARGIPLRIRNTLNAKDAGTIIGAAPALGSPRLKAVTAIRNAALVTVGGAAVLEVPDLAARVFRPVADAGIPVYMYAQASAEGSLGFAVREADAQSVVLLLKSALAREIERGDVRSIEAEGGAAVVAAVGSFLGAAPGMAGRMFSTLGRAHVNVRAMAHGGGDHTLSAIVTDEDACAAVRALHEAFALRRLRAHVFIIGTGTLGRRLADLLADQADQLRAGGLNIVTIGVANSRALILNEVGLDPSDAVAEAGSSIGTTLSLDELVARLASLHLERVIVVDATSSADVAAIHDQLLRAGIAVVTPNKSATARPVGAWRTTEEAARAGEAPYLYEAAVGAGLGVVARLRDLVRTGDRVLSIEGVLSGTVAFVLDRVRNGARFSQAVLESVNAGFAEPDVRDDLSGRDVARKLALLAREMGVAADPADAMVESLVPPALATVSRDEFMRRLPEADDEWSERVSIAEGEIQLVSRLEADGSIRAAVEAVPAGSALTGLRGAEIAVVFHTARTGETPLILRGPGASADVTAAVLLADVVRAAEAMR